jgi:hypothetical protein
MIQIKAKVFSVIADKILRECKKNLQSAQLSLEEGSIPTVFRIDRRQQRG